MPVFVHVESVWWDISPPAIKWSAEVRLRTASYGGYDVYGEWSRSYFPTKREALTLYRSIAANARTALLVGEIQLRLVKHVPMA